MPTRRRRSEIPWLTLLQFLLVPVCSFLLWLVTTTLHASDTLATKPYVDDRFLQARRYTDEKVETLRKEAEQIRKDAYEHSDRNRSDLAIELQKENSKTRESLAEVATKSELVLKAVQSMRDDAWSRDQAARHKK